MFASLTETAQKWGPLYMEEVKGMSAGSGVNVTALLVNQFREELVQFAPATAASPRRVAKCSSAFLNMDGVLALGHNDDWTQNWRNLSYWVIAHDGASGAFKWGTWLYPGYLPGMDLSWNAHGLVYSVNSLFPKHFLKGGLGTAFVARGLLEATSLDDAIARASVAGVSTAMSYNLGSTVERRLLELEVGTGGGANVAAREIKGEAYFHGNSFIVQPIPAQ